MNNFPIPSPDDAPTGPIGSARRVLSAEEEALVKGGTEEWFHLQVTYTDKEKTAQGFISQYLSGAMYWDSYIIITDSPQTKFKSVGSGQWLSDAQDVTYKKPPFYLCVTAGPRYWVYLSNYYTNVRWWVKDGQLYNDYVGGPAGFEPQDPPFYSRQLWAGFNKGKLLRDCKIIPA
jgi:hypothetical protein